MPTAKYYSKLTGKVRVTDRDFIGKGGQATVYVHKGYALKIYHRQDAMVPEQKLRELAQLTARDVLKPRDVLYEPKGQPVGYVMDYCQNAEPLCRLFAKTFKQQHGIDLSDTAELVQAMQRTVAQIHADRCLIVDLNEFNILAADGWKHPVFIDVDSYQTPSFPATAIMESIRDPLIDNNRFTSMSDWYAFAILSFQLFVGIHPFKGRHPNYKKGDWRSRMDDGASVFDPGVRLPAACGDFAVIPPALLAWYKAVFANKDRSVPPTDGQTLVAVPFDVPKLVTQVAGFQVEEVMRIDDPILQVFRDCGTTYALSRNAIWRNGRKLMPRKALQEYILFAGATQVIAAFDNGKLCFRAMDGTPVRDEPADRLVYRDGTLCSIYEETVFEHQLMEVGGRPVVAKRKLTTIIDRQTRVFDGLLLQQSLDRTIAVIPCGEGKCIVRTLPELKDYRVVHARSSGNMLAVLGQREGRNDRLVFVFSADGQSYRVRSTEDVDEHDLNFAVMGNGTCVLAASDHEVEIFRDTKTVRVLPDPPFDPTTKLFASVDGLHFISGQRLYRVRVA